MSDEANEFNKDFYLKQLKYQIEKANDPPDMERIRSLVYDGKIDITAPNDDGLSILEQIDLCSHIKEDFRKKIIESLLADRFGLEDVQ